MVKDNQKKKNFKVEKELEVGLKEFLDYNSHRKKALTLKVS